MRFDNFVLCDFDRDGIADIVAFSSRLSTAYGYLGCGNGAFLEGPALDLPTRPAAVVVSEADGAREGRIFLVAPDGAVLPFNPTADPTASVASGTGTFVAYCVTTRQGSAIAVWDRFNLSCTLYDIRPDGTKRVQSMQIQSSRSPAEWYKAIVSWSAVTRPR